MKMPCFLLAAVVCLSSSVFAVDVSLSVGDDAPKFAVQDDQGKEWKAEDHFGKKIVVIYFYPADMTGGCTKQACGFRDDSEALKKLGVEVIGVSGDSVGNHKLFKKAHDLNFTLLADVKGEVAAGFGVPFAAGEKSIKRTIDGKEETLTRFGTSKRWTFVVDEDGKIAFKNDKVQAAGDSKAILKVVKKLK